jgi:hypothetical protein
MYQFLEDEKPGDLELPERPHDRDRRGARRSPPGRKSRPIAELQAQGRIVAMAGGFWCVGGGKVASKGPDGACDDKANCS